MKKMNGRSLVICGVIAAIYAALSLVLAPFSFGPVQMRLSEALTLLPVLSPLGIYGVTVGCFLTNLIGAAMSLTNPLDILFGTFATALAAVFSFLCRKVRICKLPLVSAVFPVVFNAVVIGLEITLFTGSFSWAVFGGFALMIGAEQMIPCMVLGVLVVYLLERKGLDKKLFAS